MSTVSNGNGNAAKKTMTIRDHLQSPAIIEEIGKALPRHMKPERMARIAMTALTRTPMLSDCTQQSFFRCLLDLSQWGLEPDGRRAHLIPFRDNRSGTVECTLIIDYKGYVELAYRSGYVKNIHADVVREGDLFSYNLGIVERHTPWAFRNDADKPEKEGEIIAAYCIVQLKGEATKCEVLTRSEIDSIRSRSKAGRSGPWVTDYSEMAKKTAFRRVSKWLPLSAEVHDAFERDDDRLAIESPSYRRIEQQQFASRSAALEHRLTDMMSAEGEPVDSDEAMAISPGDEA